jgi:hypothetical protein
MKKTLRLGRALTISLVFVLSIISPLTINHASPLPERKLDAARLINTIVMPDDPEAVFESARIVHNVTVDGEKGMRVHAKFQVKYGKGVPCLMIAYFYYDDSDNTRLKASSEADYRAYRDTKGGVSAKTRFTPAYDPAVYNDLQLFIPYDALNMASGDTYDLKFYLSLYDNEGERSFGKSGWYRFKLTMP